MEKDHFDTVAECQAAPEQADHQFVPDVVGQD